MRTAFSIGILNYNTKLSILFLSSFPTIDQTEDIFHLGWFLTSPKQLANLTSKFNWIALAFYHCLEIVQIFSFVFFFLWFDLLSEGILEFFFFLIRNLIFHYYFLLKTHRLDMEMMVQVPGRKWTLTSLSPLMSHVTIRVKRTLCQPRDSGLLFLCVNHDEFWGVTTHATVYLDKPHILPLNGVFNISIYTKVKVLFLPVAYAGTILVSFYSSFLIHHIEYCIHIPFLTSQRL